MVKKLQKVAKALGKASRLHKKQSNIIKKHIKEMKRGGSKKGTGKKPKGSGRRLYTDENPKDTVSIKFATPTDARKTVAKVKKISKPFARKIQILTVGEQRAKVMGKNKVAAILRKAKMLSEELIIIDKLKKRINATVQQIGDSMMTGGVDSMEKYKYMLGQAHAYQLIIQEISNLLEPKEQENEQGNVIDIGKGSTKN